MEHDPNYSLFFWTDHLLTPKWTKRMYQMECYQCQTAPINKGSPHCHLCGLLFCKPCVANVHLPQRFNLKKRPFGPFTVCKNCIEQVNTRRLSILSDMAQSQRSSLNNYSDLAIIQNNIFNEVSQQIQFGIVETPGKTIVSEAFSPQTTLLHSFLGIDVNTTLKQLYASIYHSSTQQHLQSISLLLDGKIIPVDQLSKITLSQLLPVAHVASIDQINQFNANITEYPAPTPLNFAKLLKDREEKRKAEKRAKRQSFATILDTNSSIIAAPSLGAICEDAAIVEEEFRDTIQNSFSVITASPSSPDFNRERSQSPNRSKSRRDSSRSLSKARNRDQSVSRSDKKKDKEKDDNWYMALHSYVNNKPQSDEKASKILSFAKGDRLRISNQASPDWWYGVTEDGCQKGWVPASYVAPQEEVIKKLKEKQKARADRKAAQAGPASPTAAGGQ